MKVPFRKRPRFHVDPSASHEFQPIDDPGLGAFAVGGGGTPRWSLVAAVVTDNFLRKSRCGLPGCGRDRYDPLHQADPES